ncbi:MAG: hypothetical protein SGI73_20520 [Chloroflexota bacterium]|nr:hypothetical protein [Chloroflexota bacterium]
MIENTPRNPYHADPDDRTALLAAPFAGRSAILGRLYRHFNDPAWRTAVAVLGGRRMGKSALLLALPGAFRETHVGAVVSLAHAPDDLTVDWILALAEAATLATARRGFSIRRLDDLPPPGDTSDEAFTWFAEQFLPALFGILRSIMRLVLLLDDAHLLVASVKQERLPAHTVAFLAGLLRDFPELDMVLTLDAEREAELDALIPLIAPDDPLRLAPLELDDTGWLLQQPIRGLYAVPDDTAAAVQRATGGLPALTQQFGYHLFQQWSAQPDLNAFTPEHIKALTPQVFASAAPDFQVAWNRLPAAEKIVLAALSSVLYRDPLRHVDASTLESWIVESDARLDIPAINAALRGLAYRAWVETTADGVRLSAGLAHTWLLDNATPDKLPRLSRRRRTGRSASERTSDTDSSSDGAGGLARRVRVPTMALVAGVLIVAVALMLWVALSITGGGARDGAAEVVPTVTLAATE